MSGTTSKTQTFEGTVDSTSPAFQGLHAPATLTPIEHDSEYECRFVFFVGGQIKLTVRAPKVGGTTVKGTAKDPRGWDVSFVAELKGNCVSGSYVQPHDHGTFTLKAV